MRKYELVTYEKYGDQTQVVALTKPGTTVLDVGCASGPIAQRLKEKGCRVTGIELDPIAAKKAQRFCEKIIIDDLETIEKLPYSPGYFEVIIYSNVLEHLKDPLAVLKKFDCYLKENGYCLVVLPNIAHWLFRLEHLFGIFKYRPCGVMDETHLRFFTRKTGERLLSQAGYKIQETRFTVSGLQLDLIKRLDFLQELLYCITSLRPTLFAPQFIFVARKKK